ncbi:5'/3'-nucleotidase SurE [Motiliproteus sp. SC1-56]|uniref:5'/3'-nucleotidase SurE n=1 Tax=Motiliproteus sp. SC1-56 TaxID=2799565 RepID=UPI001A8E2747|nr:5'/3'-nucleotidase SurE [Motiliproteus sp. SC1-56]
MRLLISNDDGVHAPGIHALARALAEVAEIQVIAPDRNRSGASNSLTLDRPLEAHRLDNGFVCVNGTPTDCVHLGISGLFESRPDMVVSGINAGANLGDDVLYSGTVAAAMEGRYLKMPALALSMVGSNIRHYQSGAAIACQLLSRISAVNLAPRTVLNINVPDLPLEEIKGVHITRLGHRNLGAEPVKTVCPRGQERYWIAAVGNAMDDGPGTDFYAVANGYVSITPLQADMTQYSGFDNLGEWLEGMA